MNYYRRYFYRYRRRHPLIDHSSRRVTLEVSSQSNMRGIIIQHILHGRRHRRRPLFEMAQQHPLLPIQIIR